MRRAGHELTQGNEFFRLNKLRLQPFLVTLCGLFMYRGLARKLSTASAIELPSALPGVAWLRQVLVSDKTLGIPHVLYVVAWLLLLGRTGPVNTLIADVFGPGNGPLLNVYSMWGMVLVEGFLWSPLAFLLLSSVFAQSNAEYEEAARMSGAGILRTVTRISMRLALPAFDRLAKT